MHSAPPYPAFHAVVVASGSGTRAAQQVPKQFAKWRGSRVLTHSIAALTDAGAAHIVVVVPNPGDPLALDSVPDGAPVTLVEGGDTRQASVRAGLEALASQTPERVLIHDAARPGIPAKVISRLLAALENSDGAIPVLRVADSLIVADDGSMGEPVDRDTIRRVQTPQAFHFDIILNAHRSWTGPVTAGDDAQVARAAGHAIILVEGDEALKKLTYAADFESGESSTMPMTRIGSGYDVHRLAEGEALWLGGIRIEHTHGLAGHSDADVALHAITDAVLGAIGAGDIGEHFSPSDARWAGVSSDRFLRHACALASEAGYQTGNVDVTIICEAPKIGPHRDAMRTSIASILEISADRVSVKATTTEGLGPTGRREGIAAQATALLMKKD
ncbi:MAG: bifunctional 2-C-methyl-D-erythritol 4-phosphate cytidylyltransferase/2-C-methyl-D-erythritol 2,4-cyclodiphosphate synthase [Parerythrobacter sp.]